MARLVLKIRRGSQVIGSWSLGDQPLELVIEDSQTGQVLGRFLAEGGKDEPDELPRIQTGRVEGDDLTMPLPESEGLLPSLASEPTRSSRRRTGPVDPAHRSTQVLIDQAYDVRNKDGLEALGRSDDLSLPTAESSRESLLEDVDTGSWTESMNFSVDPSLSGVFKAFVPPAEVWLRKSREWHSRGKLEVGSRMDVGGGSVGLDTEGRLVVRTGPRLTGTVTQLDGSSYDLRTGTGPLLLDLGASVILRDGSYGIYVRSSVPEQGRLDQPTEESSR